MTEGRWLDRRALATYICVRVDQVARLRRAGKLPAPSMVLGARSPRWWSGDIDAMFGASPAADRQRQAADAVAGLVQAILEDAPRRRRKAP